MAASGVRTATAGISLSFAVSSDIRALLAEAQRLETTGDKPGAVVVLKQAATWYRERQQANQALKMLRHVRRLEGLPDEPPEPGFLAPKLELPPEPPGPIPGEGRELPLRLPRLSPADEAAWCSFCCRPSAEVGRVVAAPTGTFICAGCVELARGLFEGGR